MFSTLAPVAAERQLRHHRRKRNRARHTLVRTLCKALRHHDPYTAAHSVRVGRLAAKIGRRLGLSKFEVRSLLHGGWLHDIGKFFVPLAVLNKPAALDAAEREVVMRHVSDGVRLIASFAALWDLIPAIGGHHRRINGSGYPVEIDGDLALAARVLAVADVWDALVSDRPQRRAMSREQAQAIIQAGAGDEYDPQVVAALLAVV
ncbi:MAG: HD domain-containing protein [Isosphaeraceae bacterium]